MSFLESYHIGADLGKENDYTAVCILRKETPLYRDRIADEPRFDILTVKRFPLRTSYIEICGELVKRLKRPPFSGDEDYHGQYQTRLVPAHLAFDKTGVGGAVSELLMKDEFLRRRMTRIRAVNITSGREVNETGGSTVNIPKRDLVMATLVAFERGGLKFAADLPDLPALINELRNFEMRFTAKGNDAYSAKGTNHDDMVLALSLAVWSAQNTLDDPTSGEKLRRAMMPWRGQRKRG